MPTLSPAMILVLITIGCLILARILAYFTTRPPSNNGLRYDWEIRNQPRIR